MSEESRGRFETRTATKADASTLIGLFNRAFNKQKDARTAEWKYFGNPHGASYTLLADDAGKTGGAYSYVFRKATIEGVPFLATQASDAMVDVEFRKRGIFTSFDDAAAKHCAALGAPVCYAVAGRQSMHGFLKNGWKAIGTYQQYVAVLDARRLLARRLPEPLATGGGLLLAAALAVTRRRAKRGRVEGLDVRRVARFDPRVDRLYAEVAPSLPIAFVRDMAYLDWRYVGNPTKKHRVALAERGNELLGYVVYETAADPLNRGYVVDVLGKDSATEDALLRFVFDEFASEGISLVMLSTLPCPRVAAMLARNGFFPHPKKTSFRTATPFIVRVLRAEGTPPPTVLLDPTRWYVFDGDRDVEHVSPA